MALKGFLSTDNYTVVIVDEYDKQNKRLSFVARTYIDDSKEEVLTESNYDIEAPMEMCCEVLSKDTTSVPGSPSEDDKYIVGSTNEAPWHGMAGAIATWKAGNWQFETCADTHVAYVADEDEHYVMKDGSWELGGDDLMTGDRWDARFGAAEFEAEDQNLLQAIYDWLKEQPEFEHTTDA